MVSSQVAYFSRLACLVAGEGPTLVLLHGGAGSSNHLAFEKFKALTGTDILHVPYTLLQQTTATRTERKSKTHRERDKKNPDAP